MSWVLAEADHHFLRLRYVDLHAVFSGPFRYYVDRDSCNSNVEFNLHISNNVPSSTYTCTYTKGKASLDHLRAPGIFLGPVTVPCGTPAFG